MGAGGQATFEDALLALESIAQQQAFHTEPFPVIGDVINVNSPLRYDNRMLGGLITYARAGQVCYITPFILAGAMSPITTPASVGCTPPL